jgi:hypothetical protein
MYPLVNLLLRIFSGESLCKATPAELSWYSGFFFFFPIYAVLFVAFGRLFLDHAGAFGVWVYSMVCIGVAGTSLALWARFVPAAVSWVLAAMVWGAALWLAFSGRI